MMEDVLLSSSVTILQYKQFETDENQERIANFLQERFTERYITPLHSKQSIKHGFCTMAISCLMIETLESFWLGWPDSDRKSEKAFTSFFERCQKQDSALGIFLEHARDFYKSVRCGILHQAETSNGWRISRKGALLDVNTKTINATGFHNELEQSLLLYCNALEQSCWNAEIWQNFRNKMNAVIENCEVQDT